MRSTTVGLTLAAILGGCATGSDPGRTTPPVVAGEPAPAASPSSVSQDEARARALMAMGDLDGAAEELRAFLRLSPDAVQARYALAVTLMAKQDWSSARSELDERSEERRVGKECSCRASAHH